MVPRTKKKIKDKKQEEKKEQQATAVRPLLKDLRKRTLIASASSFPFFCFYRSICLFLSQILE
jgi:hypothetical protein